jgi:hypothetical protein
LKKKRKSISYGYITEDLGKTHRLLTSVFTSSQQRIMILLDVEVQEMICGKILAAFRASVYMVLRIVDFVFFVG